MFSPVPTDWLASWSEDGAAASFTLADLTDELTAAEADAVTGDWRDIFKSLVEHTWAYFNGLAAANKPAKLTITKNVEVVSETQLKITHTIVSYVDIGTTNVSAES